MDPMKTHGVISWFELTTTDVEGAKKFYGELFGWEFVTDSSAGMEYTMAKLPEMENPVAGVFDKNNLMVENKDQIPPHWGQYVTVTNCDESAGKVKELGGNVLVPPTDIPGIGRFAVIQDPQGAVISIFQYNV